MNSYGSILIYISFYLSLLKKNLFFTRLDKFDDPLEGLPENTLEHIMAIEFLKEAKFNMPDQQNEELQIRVATYEKNNKEEKNSIQTTMFANCWFISKKESIAMWNLYSNPDSVAIRYKPEELLEIVLPIAKSYTHNDFKILLYGMVEYDDVWPINLTKGSDKNIRYAPYRKDDSYEHEKEFRFTVAVPKKAANKYDSFKLPLGDIENDTFKIFAHPKMDEWKFNNLKILLGKFELSDKLEKSTLYIK